MVKCPRCKIRFETNAEFYRHVYDVHNGDFENLEEKEIIHATRETLSEVLKKIKGYAEVENRGEEILIKITRFPSEWYINVWNCRGTLYCGKEDCNVEYETRDYFRIPKCIIGDYNKIVDLLWQVIEDRGGGINISGLYYFDEEHEKKLLDEFKVNCKRGV